MASEIIMLKTQPVDGGVRVLALFLFPADFNQRDGSPVGAVSRVEVLKGQDHLSDTEKADIRSGLIAGKEHSFVVSETETGDPPVSVPVDDAALVAGVKAQYALALADFIAEVGGAHNETGRRLDAP